mgnify:CR=1 FL=1
MDFQCNLSLHFTGYHGLSGRTKNEMPGEIPLLLLYCTYGDVLSNLIWCGIMMMLSYCSIRGLIYARGQSGERRRRQFFHISVLCFVASEYCLWTSGCFFSGKSVISPSFWSDLLLTASLIGILPAARKAVSS